MSAAKNQAHVPARQEPPKRTCGMQWDKGEIPPCLPDIGTRVRFTDGNLVGVVSNYEYYVEGQTTFPVTFSTGMQTVSMDEVEVVDSETPAPTSDNIADINAVRARRRATTRTRRCESTEAPEQGGSEISDRGVC